jgi:hypothetical protein
VGAFGVVVPEVALQVELEAGLLGDQLPGEGGFPALLQDGLLDALHAPIGLGLGAAGRVKVRRARGRRPYRIGTASPPVGFHPRRDATGPLERRKVRP